MNWTELGFISSCFLAIILGFRYFFLDPRNLFFRILLFFLLVQASFSLLEYEIYTATSVDWVETLTLWHNTLILLGTYGCAWIVWIFAMDTKPVKPWVNKLLFTVLFLVLLFILYAIWYLQVPFKVNIGQESDGSWTYNLMKTGFYPRLYLAWFILIGSIVCFSVFWAYFFTYNLREKLIKRGIVIFYLFLSVLFLMKLVFLVDQNDARPYNISLFFALSYIPMLFLYLGLRSYRITLKGASYHLINSIPNPALIVDGHFRVKYFNRSVRKVIGDQVASKFLGAKLRQVAALVGMDPDVIDQRKKQMNKLGPKQKMEMELPVRVGRREQFFSASLTPVIRWGHLSVGYMLLATDLTKAKKNAAALEVQASELEQLNSELYHFAKSASENLKTPLLKINQDANILEQNTREMINDPIQEYVRFISRNARLMNEMVDDIMDYSEIHAQEISWVRTDLNEVLKVVMETFGEELKEKNIHIDTDALPNVLSSFPLMVQLFKNLIENGIKYNDKPAPLIKIKHQQDENWDIISIEDNGIGIEPVYQDQIFEIFRRLHNQDQYSGTGIGLAICKRIMDLHHGKIELESELGKGTTFYVKIPKAKF